MSTVIHVNNRSVLTMCLAATINAGFFEVLALNHRVDEVTNTPEIFCTRQLTCCIQMLSLFLNHKRDERLYHSGFPLLVDALCQGQRMADAFFLAWQQPQGKVQLKAMRRLMLHLDKLNSAEADMIGMALWREKSSLGYNKPQMMEYDQGTLDLHSLPAAAAKYAVLAMLEETRFAVYHYLKATGKHTLASPGPAVMLCRL